LRNCHNEGWYFAMTKQKEVGDKGERLAETYLQKKGLQLLERNYHAQGGEIDLIMKDPEREEYILVEVKTRRSDVFGDGAAAITPAKFEKILAAAESYFIKKMEMEDMPFFRVDAVIVRINKDNTVCEHIEEIGFEDFE